MEEFLNKIEELEESDMIASEYLQNDDLMVTDISIMANNLLIDVDGNCNWDNIEIMKNHNYDVFPLERDRFGWLIGAIQTSKGIITYG